MRKDFQRSNASSLPYGQACLTKLIFKAKSAYRSLAEQNGILDT